MTSVNKIIFILLSLILISCYNKLEPFSIFGSTQGTTYTIKYHSEHNVIAKKSIDSLLNIIDQSMSTYIDSSIISKLNNNIDVDLDSLIQYVLNRSIEICNKTDGMFDITVSPIVEDWGFGPKRQKKKISDINIDSYQIGCDQIILNNNKLIKHDSVKIDLNGIAQGFTVDYLANFLRSMNVDDFMIEVGGELVCEGDNVGKGWKIGVDSPSNKSQDFIYILNLSNISLATSGSYRNYYYSGSHKISHTINPKKKLPAINELISVTILSSDCITADAYATACMSFGLVDSKIFMQENDIIGSLIYVENNDTLYYFSEGFSSFLHRSPGSAPQ